MSRPSIASVVSIALVAAAIGCTPEVTGRPVSGAPATIPYVATVPSVVPTLTVEQVPFKPRRAREAIVDPTLAMIDSHALGAARPAFASYLTAMHNKIHPLFMERLDELNRARSGRAQSTGLDDPSLFSVVEMVLRPNDGAIVRRGIVKASGVTALDMIALNTVDLAAPFGTAPDVLVSNDGLAYVRWELHRNPTEGCSPRGAWPMIKRPPSTPPP